MVILCSLKDIDVIIDFYKREKRKGDKDRKGIKKMEGL
jgi:hypothetical protein